jgi:hypothetical protein
MDAPVRQAGPGAARGQVLRQEAPRKMPQTYPPHRSCSTVLGKHYCVRIAGSSRAASAFSPSFLYLVCLGCRSDTD